MLGVSGWGKTSVGNGKRDGDKVLTRPMVCDMVD